MRSSLQIRCVNGFCPFLYEHLGLDIPKDEALKILLLKGYELANVDLVKIARSRIGKTKYQLCRHPDEAPDLVDCATFTRWLYGHLGIWLPRYCIQQRELGEPVIFGDHLPGDLVFCKGAYGKFWIDPLDNVGHVGIITSKASVVHAAGSTVGVIESSLQNFCRGTNNFRGIRRICDCSNTTILKVRPGRLVETADDLRWDILNIFGR